MFDQQNGYSIAADFLEQALQRLGLGRVHSGGRLIEREKLRLRRQGAGDLEAALIAIRKMLRQVVGALGHAHVAQQLIGAFFNRRFLRTRRLVAKHRPENACLGADVAADHHVLER